MNLASLLLVFFGLSSLPMPLDRDQVAVQRALVEIHELEQRVVRVRTLKSFRFDSSSRGEVIYDYTYGSGAVLGSQGIIVTAYHLVRDRNKVAEQRREVAVLFAGSERYVPSEVIAEDARADLALLRVNRRALPSGGGFSSHRASQPRTGDPSYVVGLRAEAAPESFEVGVIAGQFLDPSARLESLYHGDLEGRGPWVGITQRIFPGYSGGPILDASGALQGIVVGAPEVEGEWKEFSFGVSAERIDQLLGGGL